MSRQAKDAQPAAQAGNRKANRVKGAVGVLRSSVDLWESITHEERREGTYPHAAKRSEGRGDGSRELPAPDQVRKLQIALYRKAKAEPKTLREAEGSYERRGFGKPCAGTGAKRR